MIVKVKIQQFLFGKNHSWAIVGQNLGRALLKMGHEVDFISTDGFYDKFCPEDLKPFFKPFPEKDEPWPYGRYDLQISYTAPINWPNYLQHGNSNRAAIWNYEYNSKSDISTKLLQGFAKFHHNTDWVMPSSQFSKEVFISMGVPDNRMVVVPHGINLDDFKSGEKTSLRTQKTHKILLNIAQPHKRKAIPLALEGFGKAFTKKDDVCLVAKVMLQNKKDYQFDVDFRSLYKTFERKFPNHAEVELVSGYIPNIVELYNACTINYSGTYAECWHLPSLESLAAGLVNVVPRYGGILDFCTDSNSLLIDGEIVRCPRDHQYWNHNPFAVHFKINTDDAADKLQKSVNNYDELKATFGPHMKNTAAKFTWENAANQILELCR